MTQENLEFDYVISGGGSAGCVLAERLSQNGRFTVCLIEAGSRDWSPLIHIPAGVPVLLPGKHMNWAMETVPQKGLNGRKGYQPRGKTLGGSSSINAMLYLRGHRWDYDHWAELGNEGWAYDDILPYFRKSENNERGGDEFHGSGGLLNVADLRSPNPYNSLFLDAVANMQHPLTPDFNGAQQEGGSRFQVTQRNGQRCSTAVAFLKGAENRNNLKIITHAQTARVLLDGNRATGVEVIRKGNQKFTITARREVILSSGAFGSPQTLMLSGIGPADHLKHHGIDVVHDLKGVGQNLQDHIDYVKVYKRPSWKLLGYAMSTLLKLPKESLQYLFQRKGMLSSTFAETGAFLRTDPREEIPDIQLHFVPAVIDDHNRNILWGTGMSCHVCLLRPKSIGQLQLNSADIRDTPKIDPAFLTDEDDIRRLIRGYRMTNAIMQAPPLNAKISEEIFGRGLTGDAEIEQELRNRADSVYHPVGSCKMGIDEAAVVAPDLKVHGIDRLRVVDASVMPTLPGGNTNAPTIMVAEKAADMVLATSDRLA